MLLLGFVIISSLGYTIYNCSNIYISSNKKKLLNNENIFTDYNDINNYDIELNYLDAIEDKLDQN